MSEALPKNIFDGKENLLEISVTHSTSTAHKITLHQGKCQYLHGHNYNFKIVITSTKNTNTLGMVDDFGVLKKNVREILDDLYDHKTIVFEEDPEAVTLKQLNMVRLTTFNPTAENMAYEAYTVIRDWMTENRCPCLRLVRVEVEETTGCVAYYSEVY